LRFGQCFAAHLGFGVASGLSLRGGVGFSDLAFFAAGGGFGNGSSLGAARGFDAFCGGGAGCFFGFAECTTHGGVCVFRLMGAGSLGCVTCCGLCGCCGSFGFGLGE
jgi:hypothetical protein